MPQCQYPVFCCFCVSEMLHRKYSQNWTKQVLDLIFFPDEGRGPKESWRGARGQPHNEGARPSPWPRPLCVRMPWQPPDDAPSPIKSLGTENPRGVSEISRIVPQRRRRRSQISGNRSLCSGTLLGRGSAPGAISIAVSIDLTAISINLAVSCDEEGVVLPRG
jgi:hypothetical protein